MDTFRITFNAMGSACELVIGATSQADANVCARAAIQEVQRIEAKYSRFRPNTVVSKINANAGGLPIKCDDETWSLLQKAKHLFEGGGGLFDITSGVLGRVWDFKEKKRPSDAELSRARSLVGWGKVELGDQTVRLTQPGMQLDFGGFGKEYATDCAAAVLKANGVVFGYVNLAGDMNFLGPKPNGTPWIIGIRHPRNASTLLASIPMSTGGLATSGDYERYFEVDGKRYCHILRPDTGLPVTYWQSVSVIASSASEAGACSTISMLKQAEAVQFLTESGHKYLAMDQLGDLHYTTANHRADKKANHAHI